MFEEITDIQKKMFNIYFSLNINEKKFIEENMSLQKNVGGGNFKRVNN